MIRIHRQVKDTICNQLASGVDTQCGKNKLQNRMEMWVIFVAWIISIVTNPFNRIHWLFVIHDTLLFGLFCNDGCEKFFCTSVATPNIAKLGDEILHERAKNGVKYAKFCGRKEDVLCVLGCGG